MGEMDSAISDSYNIKEETKGSNDAETNALAARGINFTPKK